MEDVLDKILVNRRRLVQTAKAEVSFTDLERSLDRHSPAQNFKDAIILSKTPIAIIAEMKRKSPSAGVLRGDYRVSQIAADYEKGGADALSVLTEPDFFGGEPLDMDRAKNASGLPILCKDFIFDAYQILEAKVHGADAVLLIADMLSSAQLQELAACAVEYKMDPLVEVFSEASLNSALNCGADLLGINARNLRTLEMIPDNVGRLSPLIPNDRLIVAESGIRGPEDIKKLKSLRVAAVLVGESILRQDDLENAVRVLKQAA